MIPHHFVPCQRRPEVCGYCGWPESDKEAHGVAEEVPRAAHLRIRRENLASAADACEDPEMLLSAQALLQGEVDP